MSDRPMLRTLLPLALMTLILGCTGSDTEDLVKILETKDYSELKFNVEQISLAAGQQQQLEAIAVVTDGTETTVDADGWFVTNPSIASISDSGVITAKLSGNTMLGYRWREQEVTIPVSVSAATLASVEISQVSFSVDECSTGVVSVSGTLTDGSHLSQIDSAIWSVSNEDLISIEPTSGASEVTLKYHRAGIVQLEATVGNFSDAIAITVSDSLAAITLGQHALSLTTGESENVTISGNYNDGSEKNISEIVSIVEEPADRFPNSIESVQIDTGSQPASENSDIPGPTLFENDSVRLSLEENDEVLVTAKAPGNTALNLQCGGMTETLTIAVNEPVVLSGVVFAQERLLLSAGQSATPIVYASYSDGTRSEVTDGLEWSIQSGDSDSFDLNENTGTVTAGDSIVIEQSIVLTVNLNGFTSVIDIFSEFGKAEELTEIRLLQIDEQGVLMQLSDSEPFAIPNGTTTQLVVQKVYNTGRTEIQLEDIFWSNADPHIAFVNSSGFVTGNANGITSITALTDVGSKTVLVLIETEAVTETTENDTPPETESAGSDVQTATDGPSI